MAAFDRILIVCLSRRKSCDRVQSIASNHRSFQMLEMPRETRKRDEWLADSASSINAGSRYQQSCYVMYKANSVTGAEEKKPRIQRDEYNNRYQCNKIKPLLYIRTKN
jgi:hypothetical protein